MKSFRNLQVYQEACQLAKEVHSLTMKLPRYEMFELGSQIRRSAQSVRANIVEGYGRRRYKNDFIRFLTQSYGSCLETLSHTEMLNDLYPESGFRDILTKYEKLGARLFKFISFVEISWRTDNRQLTTDN